MKAWDKSDLSSGIALVLYVCDTNYSLCPASPLSLKLIILNRQRSHNNSNFCEVISHHITHDLDHRFTMHSCPRELCSEVLWNISEYKALNELTGLNYPYRLPIRPSFVGKGNKATS